MNSAKLTLQVLLILTFTAITSISTAQELSKHDESAEESTASRILKSAGSLLVKEFHVLPNIRYNIKCKILIIRNLLDSADGKGIYVGFSISEKDGNYTRSSNIDSDEVDGLLASVEIFEKQGVQLMSNPLAHPQRASSSSVEIAYTTKDGLTFGVYRSKEEMKYALRITRTSDWILLKDDEAAKFVENLKEAKKVAQQIAAR